MDQEAINNLITKILDGEHTGAKEDFEQIISQKLNDALDAKKAEVAQSIYGAQPVENETGNVEGEDAETETSNQETEDAVQ